MATCKLKYRNNTFDDQQAVKDFMQREMDGEVSYYSLDERATPEVKIETLNKVNKFLEAINVDVEIGPMTDKYGNPISALAVASFMDATIKITDDINKRPKAWNQLPEEAAHFWYRLSASARDGKMTKLAKADPLYKEVVEQYGDVYGLNNEKALVEETVGKLIAREIIRIENGEEPATWWQEFITWVKKILGIYKEVKKQAEETPFHTAAAQILANDTTDLLYYADTYADMLDPDKFTEKRQAHKKLNRDTLAAEQRAHLNDLLKRRYRLKSRYLPKTLERFRNVAAESPLPIRTLDEFITFDMKEVHVSLWAKKELFKKYKKSPIALNSEIKVDGARKPELDILNTVRDLIKKENPTLKTIDVNEFAKEVDAYLDQYYQIKRQPGYVDGWNKYRLENALTQEYEKNSHHNRVGFYVFDKYFTSGHATKNPYAWYNTLTVVGNEPLEFERDGVDENGWGIETSKPRKPKAVVLHEIQSDQIETVRSVAGGEDQNMAQALQWLYGKDPYLKTILNKVSGGSVKEAYQAFKHRLYELEEKVTSDRAAYESAVAQRRRDYKTKDMLRQITRGKFREDYLALVARLRELTVNERYYETTTKKGRKINVMIPDSGMLDVSADLREHVATFKSKISREYNVKDDQALSDLIYGMFVFNNNGTGVFSDLVTAKSDKQAALLISKRTEKFLYKRWVNNELGYKLNLRNIWGAEKALDNRLSLQRITIEQFKQITDVMRTNAKKMVEDAGIRPSIETAVTKKLTDFESHYTTPMITEFIIENRRSGVPMYFAGAQATMLLQGSAKTANIYRGPDEITGDEKVGYMYAQMSKIKGIKLIWEPNVEFFQGETGAYRIDATEFQADEPYLFSLEKTAGQQTFENIATKEKDITKVVNKDENFYRYKGKEVKHRVTDIAKAYYQRIFPDKQKEDWQQAIDELKKDKGTQGHADLEDIFHRYVDEKTGLLRGAPLSTKHVHLGEEMYTKLEKNLSQRLRDIEKKNPGTRFRSEVMIYDSKKDEAGTIDFMAISPEGKITVLDWKFISVSSKYEELPFFKQKAWDLQLEEYRNILKREYGIREDQFLQTRAIPILANYKAKGKDIRSGLVLTGIEVGAVNPRKEKNELLLPSPTRSESTGNEQLDRLITKLRGLGKLIEARAVSNNRKDLKADQLKALTKAILHLQIKQSFEPFLQQADVFLATIKATLDKYQTLKPDSTPEQIKEYADELNGVKEALNIYGSVDILFREFFDTAKPEEAKLLHKMQAVSVEARSHQEDLMKTLNKFGNTFIAGKRGIQDLTNAERVIKGVVKYFRTLSQAGTKALQTLWLMKSEATQRTDFETDDEVVKLTELKEEYNTWALAHGKGLRDHFDILKKKKNGKPTNSLIDKYDPEFYKELNAAVKSGNVAWIKANIDLKAFEAWAKEYKAKRTKEINATIYSRDKTDQKARVERELSKMRAQTDLSKREAFLNYYNVKQYPLDKWKSKEYQEIEKPENAPVMKFFNYITEWNQKAVEYDYLEPEKARTFLPYIRKTLADKVVFGGGVTFGQSILSSITVDDAEIGFGHRNEITGKIEDRIPKYFTKDISETEDYSDISTDLFKNMGIFIRQVIDYKNLSNLESQAKVLLSIEENKGSLQTNIYGSIMKDELGRAQKLETNKENAQLFEDFMKSAIYKQKYTNTDSVDAIFGKVGDKFSKFSHNVNQKLGWNVLPENMGERKFSMVKSIDGVNRWFQLKVLGLNVATSIANFMGGNFQALISAGKYFTASEFFASEFKLAAHKIGAGDVKLQTALMRYFLPLTEGAVSNEIRTLSLSKVSQASFSEMMMVLMRKAEHAIQYTIFNSMMENAMVENGQIVNIREYLRNQPEFKNRYSADAATRRALEKGFEAKVSELQATRSLYKIAELKGDELHIPGIDRKSDSVIKYRNLIHQLSKNATGNVTEDDMSKIRMNVITRSFMVFKNWIPRLVDVRVGELRYNVGTDAYEWGRMRMVAKMLFSEGFFALNRLKNVLSANDKGVEYLTKLYEQKKADYELANNTEFTMSKEEFFDMVRAGIKAQFRDTLVLTSLVALFLFLKAEAPDDDEDKETISRYKYAVRVMDKIIDEISFYYNPISFQQILNGSVFPALGVVTDMAKLFNSVGEELYGLTFNDEEVTESAKPIKYVLKTFPISHQFLTFVPLLDPEMAKELGVKTTTESRLR